MWINLFQQMRINPLKLNRKTNLFRQIRLLRFLIKCKVLRSDFQEQKGNFYTLLFSYLYLFSFFPFSSFCRPDLQGDYGKPCSFGYTGNYALQAYAIFVYEIEFYKDIHHNKKYPCMILLRATADM